MVSLISERGPKIDEVARLSGNYNETVRHWYKSLLERGLEVQASCNYERLGMKRVIAIVEFGNIFKDCADLMFSELCQVAYAVGYAKLREDVRYISGFSIPDECATQWTDFMLELKRMGVFGSVESISLDWVRNVPMQGTYFDFSTAKWKRDWRNNASAVPVDVDHDQRQKYDAVDLKIIEQLQVDASVSLTEVFEKIAAKNYNTLAWHYRVHVLGRGLIRGYRLNFTPLRSGPKSGKSRGKKQSYSWVDLVANGLSENEKQRLRTALARIPFVWIEGSGPKSHYARIACPSHELTNVVRFLRDSSPGDDSVRLIRLDPGHALSFSLSNNFYDEELRRWTFKKDEALQRFEALGRIRREIARRRSTVGS